MPIELTITVVCVCAILFIGSIFADYLLRTHKFTSADRKANAVKEKYRYKGF